jgi:plastocyanin
MLADSTPNNSSLGPSSTARVHVVTVGKGAHRFDPETLTASVGDVVTFEFFPLNHSVVRAQYRFPCIPYEDVVIGQAGFFSGLIPISDISDDVRSVYPSR